MVEEIKPNLFVVKTKKGYRQVFPIKKDLSKPFGKGNINWRNLLIGSTQGLILTILVIVILLSYTIHTEGYRDYIEEINEDPCFLQCIQKNKYLSESNLSELDIDLIQIEDFS
jgi:hypothetical protein